MTKQFPRPPDQTCIFLRGQDHLLINAERPRESPGVSRPQRLVDLVSASVFAWRKGFPLGVRLALRWPNSIVSVASSTGLLGKILSHIGVRTASGILKRAFVDLLRKRCPVGGHVGSDFGIRPVEEQEIYEVDRWCQGHSKRLHIGIWKSGGCGGHPANRGTSFLSVERSRRYN